MASKFNTINEPFTGVALPGGWATFAAGSATFAYSTGGAQVVYPASTSNTFDGEVNTTTQYDLTGNRVFVNVLNVPAGATSTDCFMTVRASGSNTNRLEILWEAGTLYMQKIVASAQTNLTSFTYNATTHAWWSIRENGGTTYWETSPDGINWTVQFSATNPITVTSMDYDIGSACFGVDNNNTAFTWRSFNLNNPSHPVNRGLRPHLFSPGLAR